MTVPADAPPGIRCACGAHLPNRASLARHLESCLGTNPSVEDIYRIGRVVPEGDCLVWQAALTDEGYGVLPRVAARFLGETRAHRAVLAVDGIDMTGLYALHSCDNPPCVRREHLRPGTQLDNMADVRARGRARQIRRCRVCARPYTVLVGSSKQRTCHRITCQSAWRKRGRR